MINCYNEKLDDQLLKELIPLLKASSDEVYAIKGNNTLANSLVLENIDNHNINYNYYLEKQRQGMFHISTLRDDDKLVGSWSLVLNYHTQSKDLLVANCESLYIMKEYRKDNNAKNFMIFVENSLKNRGVKQIFFGVNPQLGTDKILKRAGWSLDEIVFSKGL